MAKKKLSPVVFTVTIKPRDKEAAFACREGVDEILTGMEENLQEMLDNDGINATVDAVCDSGDEDDEADEAIEE